MNTLHKQLQKALCWCSIFYTVSSLHLVHTSSPSSPSPLLSHALKPTKDYAGLYCVASEPSGSHCFSKNPISWLHRISGQSTMLHSRQQKAGSVVQSILLSTRYNAAITKGQGGSFWIFFEGRAEWNRKCNITTFQAYFWDFTVSWPWSDRKSSMVCSRKDRWRTDRPGLPMRREAYTSSWRRRICTAAQPRWVPERDRERERWWRVHIHKADEAHCWHLMLHSCHIRLVQMHQFIGEHHLYLIMSKSPYTDFMNKVLLVHMKAEIIRWFFVL